MSHEELRAQFEQDPWPIVGFTTTEHNTLTSMRSATIAEASSRVSSYLTTLSAALISLGFVVSASGGFDPTFFAFGAVALGAAMIVGILTFVRCVQSSIEDLRLLTRIERLRSVYLTLAPGLTGQLDPVPVGDVNTLRRGHNMGAGNWVQLMLTMAGLVGVVNSAIVGVVAGFAVRLGTEHAAASWTVAVIVALAAELLHLVVQMRTMTAALLPPETPAG